VWTDAYEVFGRRIGAGGLPVGPELRLSRMGPPSDPAWLTRSPDIAYSPGARQFLVVWQSGPGLAPYPAGEVVYGQHLSRAGGQIGSNDFAIATRDRAVTPAVTAFAGGDDFGVAWSSQHASPSLWARRVTASSFEPPVDPPEDNPIPDSPPLNPVPAGPPPLAPPRGIPGGTAPGAPAGGATPGATAPGGAVERTRGSFAAHVRGARTLRALARSGLRVAVTCPARCRATVRLRVSRRIAGRLGARTLARRSVRLAAAGTAVVRLRPRPRVARGLRAMRRLELAVRTEVRSAGDVRRLSRTVTLRR
jgi:hypothetical protein